MAEQSFKVGAKANYVSKPVTITGGPFVGYSEWYVVKGEDGKEHPAAASGLEPIPAFAVGDTVRYAYGSGGKLVAGPFKSEHHDELIWVVEKPNGTHMTPTQNSLTKVEVPDPIKVGDRVRVLEDDPDIKPGQFVGLTGTIYNVDEDDLPYGVRFDGEQGAPSRTWYVTKVEKVTAPAADTFTHDGVTYELGADYRDNEGDVWKFTGKTAEDGTPEFVCHASGYTTVADAVYSYGPLTKI
ncbi:phiSA1p31-related protein [Streptomyces caniferus]|uniref:phiSA1p31-related protein n=1 Tax=Streptomyces caniferus TaxID=285557 RepID=UPI002E2A2D8D|nr:phiSA1p31-related protein [Streptomyces caniferus]